MNIQTIVPIVLAVLIVIAIGLVILISVMRLRSRRLKKMFGPEYDYDLERLGDKRTAEADLQEREKRVVNLDIHPLSETEQHRYHAEWTDIQASFVDDPSAAVDRANQLITEVMIARGFPVADFEQRSADLSVMYPTFVPGYRESNAIATKIKNGSVSTEELRQAMINYHPLFDELLSTVHRSDMVKETEHERQSVSQ
jgi:hypothetical protein